MPQGADWAVHWAIRDPARPPISALVDDRGRFGSAMVRDGFRFFLSPRARAEIDAQFAAFAATGPALDHVNTHKHFHLHPTVLSLILRVGSHYGLRAFRLPHEPGGQVGLWPWAALTRARLERAGVGHNDQARGIAHSGRFDEAALIDVLTLLPRGLTEIYLHPATAGPEPITDTMRGYRHADELSALLSPRVREAFAETGAGTGGFTDLCDNLKQRATT
ncbi:ChbG/HpnK family deacetylase [Streptomyces sp. NPDC001508]|uniref:ChbG/HpnK family deacetylase n=1 Tax=Streptomyces sp. NPDC001508 TaxID=3154656 RepID=UPI00332E1CCA